MKYTIFNQNGTLSHILDCAEEDLAINMHAGQKYQLGDWSDCYLDAGVMRKVPTPPSEWHVWGGTAYTVDLDAVKAGMWRKIQSERTRRMEGGYPVAFGGKTWWMHSDTASLGQQQGLVQMAQLMAMQGKDMTAEIAKWKTMTGEFVSMTGNFALAMFAAGMAQQSTIFQQAEIHKAKMSALAEPWTYDFSTGWAKIYGEV